MSRSSSIARRPNTDFSQLPCGKRFEGKWEQVQVLKKAHLNFCVFCKSAIESGLVKQVVLEPDIKVGNKSDVRMAAKEAYAVVETQQYN